MDPSANGLWLESDPNTWKPVPYLAIAPAAGVVLADGGLLRQATERNVVYLLADWRLNVDDMLVWSRRLAGDTNPPGKICTSWEEQFPSLAASFLLGAGTTLQWQERPELRQRLYQVIEGLKACCTTEGGLKTPVNNPLCSGYSATLFAHGLMTAGLAGNSDAWGLLGAASREYRKDVAAAVAADPQWPVLNQNYYGVSACMAEALSPAGVSEDVETALKHTHPGWMKQLAERDPNGIWLCPVSWPHSAETYGFVGFLDIYRATGDTLMLEAMRGAWELMHDQWEHPGGSSAMCEHGLFPPRSYHITSQTHTGEMCSNVWWVRFNHKLHQLFPMEEQFANEIEKCIYNVGLANQGEDGGVRYHTNLEGRKGEATKELSCCEVLGTYLYGSLPEYIYSIADDGLFVNLYEPSSITWELAGQSLRLTMDSQFPFRPEVGLCINARNPVVMKLRVRTPAWAANDMTITVDGQEAAVGKPGTYVVLERTWADGDRVEFALPMEFRVIPYEGLDQVAGQKRYSILYGPMLMAAIGPLGEEVQLPDFVKDECFTTGWVPSLRAAVGPHGENLSLLNFKTVKNHTYLVRIAKDPTTVREWLKPKDGQPLAFGIQGHVEPYLKPYWQVGAEEDFTCFPAIG